jgi:ribosomal-protein-alanine N-acetyltransferase
MAVEGTKQGVAGECPLGQWPRASELCVKLDFLRRPQFAAVLAIERESFEYPWSELDFVRVLKNKSVLCRVARVVLPPAPGCSGHGEVVFGYVVNDYAKTEIVILNLAVATWARRRGVGRLLVESVVRKLSPKKRRVATATVREKNLAAQLFFRACGFRATGVIECPWEEPKLPDESAYVFCRPWAANAAV